MKFRDLVKMDESPVGVVGRTSAAEAKDHVDTNELEKEFYNMIKKLGGKTVAKELISRLDKAKREIETNEPVNVPAYAPIMGENKVENISSYLRNVGFKIKKEIPTKSGIELEFFDVKSAKEAFEDLKSAGFMSDYDIDLVHSSIFYIEK